jgi:predicted TIM-barrel fold metal-dependent hydrolase
LTMSKLDAHAHFFLPGFAEIYPAATRRVQPDEVTLYAALAQQHAIRGVLAVGYEGMPWAVGNNGYLAQLARQHAWIYPLAYAHDVAALTPAQLDDWQAQGFVGISLYLLDAAAAARLAAVSPAVWQALADHRMLISVNGHADCWQAWQPILAQWPALRLLVSHLGLPLVAPAELDAAGARQRLAALLALCHAPNVYVKLSGFYALAAPTHAYPHRDAWPYVEQIAQDFGVQRLLWGSDFSPALEHVSFVQSVDLLEHMPYFSPAERQAIYGDTLAALLRTGVKRSE